MIIVLKVCPYVSVCVLLVHVFGGGIHFSYKDQTSVKQQKACGNMKLLDYKPFVYILCDA